MFDNGKWKSLSLSSFTHCFRTIRKGRVYDRSGLQQTHFIDETEGNFIAEIGKNNQRKNKFPKNKTGNDGLRS